MWSSSPLSLSFLLSISTPRSSVCTARCMSVAGGWLFSLLEWGIYIVDRRRISIEPILGVLVLAAHYFICHHLFYILLLLYFILIASVHEMIYGGWPGRRFHSFPLTVRELRYVNLFASRSHFNHHRIVTINRSP